MRFFVLALFALLVSCAPADTRAYPVPDNAGRFAKITLEGPDSLDSIVEFSKVLDVGKDGFVFRGFNEERTAIATTWLKVAGQPVRVYFVFEDIDGGTLVRVLTEPSPPPTANLLAQSLTNLTGNVVDSFKGAVKSVKLEADQ